MTTWWAGSLSAWVYKRSVCNWVCVGYVLCNMYWWIMCVICRYSIYDCVCSMYVICAPGWLCGIICVHVHGSVCAEPCGMCDSVDVLCLDLCWNSHSSDTYLLFLHKTDCFPPHPRAVAGDLSQDHYLSHGEGDRSKHTVCNAGGSLRQACIWIPVSSKPLRNVYTNMKRAQAALEYATRWKRWLEC